MKSSESDNLDLVNLDQCHIDVGVKVELRLGLDHSIFDLSFNLAYPVDADTH